MAKESSQHKGHRQRMRARVEQYGLESLAPHEALEYVLYITNTRKDTNGLAHVLMDRFGDFAGVLDASEEDLLTVHRPYTRTAARCDRKNLPRSYVITELTLFCQTYRYAESHAF